MPFKAVLQQWNEATVAYDKNDPATALSIFDSIADNARIFFNMGLILAETGDHKRAVEAFTLSLEKDPYFAVASFQRGISKYQMGSYSEALLDFDQAIKQLRGNSAIDYTQLGLDFLLHSCECKFNQAICHFFLNDEDSAYDCLDAAQREAETQDQMDLITDVCNNGTTGEVVFSLTAGKLFRPPASLVENAEKVDHLGFAKLVIAVDPLDSFTGFAGRSRSASDSSKTSEPVELPQRKKNMFIDSAEDNFSTPRKITRSVSSSDALRSRNLERSRQGSLPNTARNGRQRSDSFTSRPSRSAASRNPSLSSNRAQLSPPNSISNLSSSTGNLANRTSNSPSPFEDFQEEAENYGNRFADNGSVRVSDERSNQDADVLPAEYDLLANNQLWAEVMTRERPEVFQTATQKRNPKILWIGCSDSQVPANEIVGLDPSEIFVHRNLANQVPSSDTNVQATLQYAISVLKVEQIIVCGHFGCSGVAASLSENSQGDLLNVWLQQVKDVYSIHRRGLEAIPDRKARETALVGLNVVANVCKVSNCAIVQNAWANGQKLTIRSWVYKPDNGQIKDLGICIENGDQARKLYRTTQGTVDG